MSVTIVAGAQWGDEGKGKIVDSLAAECDIVMRCQGGPNAGHTIVNERGRFALHAVPSGIFHPRVPNIIGPGVLVDPIQLAAEIEALKTAGVEINLLVSERAHLILPYHVALDRSDDGGRPAELRVGSTGCGVGPAYADKAARVGVRAGDLRKPAQMRQRIAVALERNNALLQARGGCALTASQVATDLQPAIDALLPYIGDTFAVVETTLRDGRKLLLEGQLGVMRDIDWGVHPFVTSSCTTPAGIAAGAGIPPQAVTRSIGVMKAYTTSVGEGPFPTEIEGDASAWLREAGGEFGATTGRPRRCGWLDLPAARWACSVAGFTEIAMTKLDILDNMPEIPVCVEYRRSGKPISPSEAAWDWENVEPVYRSLPGWRTSTGQELEHPADALSTAGARRFDDLPEQAREYVRFCAKTIGVPISMIGVGCERDAIVHT